MASAKNKVIAGDYYNYKASANIGTVTISMILVGTVNIDSTTVKRYEVITDEQRKSAMSGAARGLAGKMLLGDVGAMAGVYSAKTPTCTVLLYLHKKSLFTVLLLR